MDYLKELSSAIESLAKRVRKLEVKPELGGGWTPDIDVNGHIIQDEGVSLTQREFLNFVGAGVVATDDPATQATIVTINGTNANNSYLVMWYADGLLEVIATFGKTFVVPYDGNINKVILFAEDCGDSSSTIIDVHKNGTTVYTTQANRPTLAYDDANKIASTVPDVIMLVANDLITIDFDQIAPGARNATVILDISTETVSTAIRPQMAIWTVESELEVTPVPWRIYNRTGYNRTIKEVHINVPLGYEPTGADIIVDVHKNGTTIFTDQNHRPVIAASASTGVTTDIDVPLWADEEYLHCYVDQIGSTYVGAHLVIQVISE